MSLTLRGGGVHIYNPVDQVMDCPYQC
jgi:hypothetical protein